MQFLYNMTFSNATPGVSFEELSDNEDLQEKVLIEKRAKELKRENHTYIEIRDLLVEEGFHKYAVSTIGNWLKGVK